MIRRLWMMIPADVREPLKSYVVSTLLGLWPTIRAALSVGISLGVVTTFQTAVHFLAVNAFMLWVGTLFDLGPFYRARQGAAAAKKEEAVMPLPNATKGSP